MNNWLWYLTRSTGIVAAVLMLAALAWGFLFSARETGMRLRPAWWLDLHNGLGGLAMIFTGIHLVTAFADSDLGISLVSMFVPGTAHSQRAALTWGVLAFYGLTAAVLTTWPRKLRRRQAWRVIHLLSVPATVLAIIHAYQIGSDAHTTGFEYAVPVLVAAAMYPFGLRVFKILQLRARGTHNQS